jgi:hypothetical protein
MFIFVTMDKNRMVVYLDPNERPKMIGVRKVDSLLEMEHPNGIKVGYEAEGPYLGQEPVVGQCFYISRDNGLFRTSTVQEIISPTRFRTLNSIYEWSVYEKPGI